MTLRLVTSFSLLLGVLSSGLAEEKLPRLKVGSEVYTNVTVTSVTATDVYFSHSRGMGNAKLKNLEPELQKRFNYDPAKASAKQQQQSEAHALYNQAVREAKPNPARPAGAEGTETGDSPEQEISAKSFLNQAAPSIVVEKWLTDEPEMSGKFVIVDFWATWCAPCRRSIPELNALASRFPDKLVIMGLSDEPEEKVRAMKEPSIDYFVGIDTQHRSISTIGIRAIPHALLIDPKGVVRFEGHPSLLNADRLEKLMGRYSE